ncbi:hypothetical protein [Blastococcus sp. TF02-8]|uniref:hypothetical protein n=1 Tax=Blastococcus sp. TF02-8 TaxID=2250574 RepID=UPI0011BFD99B|nr:hypothetical protein [Blastococcus sp. TF02-8]
MRRIYWESVSAHEYLLSVPTFTEFIHYQYRAMHDQLTECAQNAERDENAPAFTSEALYAQPEDAPHTSEETLNMAARIIVAGLGIRVRQHVGALALTYAPSDPAPEWGGIPFDVRECWPGSAAFTIARSVLEGVSSACWILAPSAEPVTRLRRVACIELWSAYNNDMAGMQPSMLPSTRDLVQGAGFDISEKNNRQPGLKEGDGRPLSFSYQVAVREVFDQEGVAWYKRWSGRAHHALWASRNTIGYQEEARDAGPGFSFKSSMEVPAHVDLASNMASVLARYVDDMATFYGRTFDGTALHNQAAFLKTKAAEARAATAG